MAMTPNINGNTYGHTSLACVIDDIQFFIMGLKELNYTQKMDPGKAYGTLPYILGRTSGQIECSGSMTLWKQEADQIMEMLGPGFMQRSWSMSVSYAESGLPTVTDQLVGVRITSVDVQSSAGNEPIAVKWELSIMYVTYGTSNAAAQIGAAIGLTVGEKALSDAAGATADFFTSTTT